MTQERLLALEACALEIFFLHVSAIFYNLSQVTFSFHDSYVDMRY